MNSERWPEIKALLGEVLDRPLEERARFLATFAGADAELKRDVGSLLESGPGEQKFLEPPPDAAIDPPLRMISLAFTGCSIGDYRLVEEIGRGSSGTVYKATQISLGRPAAVKILAHNLCASVQARARFRREAEAASKLRHESIVSIFAFGEQGGAFYIAMELVTGDNLRDLIADCVARKAGTLEPNPRSSINVSDPAVAACLVEKLARGLQHCHENGVIHRDVKPENIVIDEKRQPRLIDFGLAKDGTLDGLTDPGTLSGTPHYMSPEQARALGPAVDLRTDIYSLGVVLYELLTLLRPFEFTQPGELLHAIGHEDPRHVTFANPDVPAELAAVCMKAIAKRPQDRYSTAAAMADDLGLYLSGRRTRAQKPSVVRKAWGRAVRYRGAAAVVLLLAVAGLYVGLRGGVATLAAGPPTAGEARSAAAGLSTVAESDTALAGPPTVGESPSAIHEMREAFERSIANMSESEQLERRRGFNKYLEQRIRENEGHKK
jgi:hypothetical protein